VAVMPMPPKKNIKLLPENDLEIQTMRGTGNGGQHKNVTDSCVRMIHKLTGINIVIDGRDQHANKREAHRILSVKVKQAEHEERLANYSKLRKDQLEGQKIRTYNFIKSRAVDHRTGKSTKNVKGVIGKGQFDLLR